MGRITLLATMSADWKWNYSNLLLPSLWSVVNIKWSIWVISVTTSEAAWKSSVFGFVCVYICIYHIYIFVFWVKPSNAQNSEITSGSNWEDHMGCWGLESRSEYFFFSMNIGTWGFILRFYSFFDDYCGKWALQIVSKKVHKGGNAPISILRAQ